MLTKGICGPQGSGYNAPQDVNWSSVLLRKKGAVLEGKEDDSGSILYFHVRYSHSAETTAKAVCAKAAVKYVAQGRNFVSFLFFIFFCRFRDSVFQMGTGS